MQKNIFQRTDLAAEWKEDQPDLPHGVRFEEERMGSATVSTLFVETPSAADLAGRAMGRYQTVSLGNCLLLGQEQKDEYAALLCSLIRQAENALYESKQEQNAHGCVLVVGLGNRDMTADAVGPLTAEQVTVTNHIKTLDPALFESLKHRAVAAISPGVLGKTGVESALSVRLLTKELSPRLLIVIDALAAKSTERLCTTVQISTAGIAPGSGVGNDRPAFTEQSMGVPVLAIGVPTVTDSSTLVADALKKAGMDRLPAPLLSVLERGKSFFVSPKEVDGAVKILSEILASAIDGAMDLQDG